MGMAIFFIVFAGDGNCSFFLGDPESVLGDSWFISPSVRFPLFFFFFFSL